VTDETVDPGAAETPIEAPAVTPAVTPAATPARTLEGPPAETAAARTARRQAERQRTIAYLDLAEDRGPVRLLSDDAIAVVLRSARRIAVVGASSNEARPSFGVFRYLLTQGYDCVPVNPGERSVLGVPAFRTLTEAADATGPFDLVDVFRRAELCPAHAREAVEIGASCLWLQLGVVSWEAARIAHDGGLSVVMDRCTAIEHRRFRDR
jgi:predicted CoA-binding protein